MENIKITSFEDLKRYAEGEVVELPPFAEGQPFIARIKRPSMMGLVKRGKIPNQLLTSANKLFSKGAGGVFDEKNEETLRDMFDLFDVICEESFVEPTYMQIKEAKIELTDDQFMFLFDYSQQGVNALKSFRVEPTSSTSNSNGEVVQMPTVTNDSNI